MSERRPLSKKKRALFALLPVVLLLAGIEVTCRILVPAGDKELHYLEPDPDLVWRLKPLAGGPQATNELGLRDTTYRPDADVKLLLLGDSISYGDGERDLLKCYPHLLERALEERDPGRTYEVINSGVPGYSTFQELRYLELRGAALEPDAVILQFCLNDVTERFVSVAAYGGDSDFFGIDTRSSVRGVHGWFVQHSRAYERLARWGQDRAKRTSAYSVFELGEDELSPELEAAWQATEGDLDRLAAACKQRGLPLMVLVTPYTYQMADPTKRQPQDRLLSWAKKQGLTCVDLLPALYAGRHDRPELMFFDTNHFGPRGQEIAAQALVGPVSEFLERELRHKKD